MVASVMPPSRATRICWLLLSKSCRLRRNRDISAASVRLPSSLSIFLETTFSTASLSFRRWDASEIADPAVRSLAAYACLDGGPCLIGVGGCISPSALACRRGVTGGAAGVFCADHAASPVSPPTSGRRT
eukprot:1057181-Prorocentrum_minimum.AAC.1